ncbi:ROK family protein [Candidatus Daviesbacteria bacterium]|nr:ROK family protein [Candidatus Daviesbacteria bacterium]
MNLVFDIGGTNMRIATSLDGKTLSTAKTVPTPQDFDEGVRTIKQIADELAAGQKIAGVAGGLAGPLDKDKTMLIKSPHIESWIGKDFKQELQQILNAPVSLENDADLAALGEATSGVGAEKEIVAYLTISTGVGGGRVVNKKIDINALGFEPGHQIIVADGAPCDCGGKGHLESYVSGSGLERIYGKKSADITDPQIWDQVAKYLAVGLNNTIVHWSPDIVILGGSVMKSVDLEQVKKYLKEYLTIFPTPPEIVQAKLGDQAGLFGALSLLKPL